MRLKSLILLISLLNFESNYAQKGKINQVEQKVQEWLDAMNAHDIEALRGFYKNSVTYYTKSISIDACIANKADFFEKYPGYSITINELDIDLFKSGLIRCSFIKTEVWNRDSKNPLNGYLIFEKEGNDYKIIGESDTWTDSKFKYTPMLGSKVVKSSNFTYMLYGAGILLILVLLFYLYSQNRRKSGIINSFPMLYSVDENLESQKPIPVPDKKRLSAEKGLAFEYFVVKNFDPNYFTLLHWRGDKYIDGIYPLSSLDPDLDYVYKDSVNRCHFSIECKWKQGFDKFEKIEIAEERKLNRYREFQKSKGENYPVFIVLGISGSPSAPELIYVVPLNEIRSKDMSKSDLQKYKRERSGRFFLKFPKVILE